MQNPSRPSPFISPFGNIGQTYPACWEGDHVMEVANGRGEGRGFEKATPARVAHPRPRITHRSPLYRFTRAVLPENPKTRGFACVCGSKAERVGSIALPLLPLSLFLSLFFSPPRDSSIYLRIQPPSKPNFSLTKPFLSGNLFRDRNLLSTTILARYNSGLLNAKYYSVLRSH